MSATAWVVVGALLVRIGEAGVLLLGGVVTHRFVEPEWWFAPVLFLVVRPLAVAAGAPGAGAPRLQRRLTMWFGIRGIGSVY